MMYLIKGYHLRQIKVERLTGTVSQHNVCKKVVEVIVRDITHRLPNGYTWLDSLPKKGHKTIKASVKRWGYIIQAFCYPTFVRIALLESCVDGNGAINVNPEKRKLYIWLLQNVYNNNQRKLYQEWFERVKNTTHCIPMVKD
jgi:hypothetical protein